MKKTITFNFPPKVMGRNKTWITKVVFTEEDIEVEIINDEVVLTIKSESAKRFFKS